MYLKTPKDVTSAARPSRTRDGTQDMSGVLEVNGEATDASASDREMPACAAFSAPQSFAPSPHIPSRKDIYNFANTFSFTIFTIQLLHRLVNK